MKDLEKIKSEEVAAQVQDANPGNFAIEQEVAQLVGATVPAPTEPSAADALKNRAQLFKVRLGCQVSSNFADITKPAVPSFNGEVKPIRTNAPATGGNQGGGSDPDDGTLGEGGRL